MKNVCEDCGKIFEAKTDKAFFCPKCRKKRQSDNAKKTGLSRKGLITRRKE